MQAMKTLKEEIIIVLILIKINYISDISEIITIFNISI